MTGVAEYIAYKYPKSVYSEIKYSQDTGKVDEDFDKEGAIAILYHYLYWIPTNTGATIVFKDQFDNVLFSTIDNFSVNSYVYLPLIRDGSKLKITCSLAIVISVSYQWLMTK